MTEVLNLSLDFLAAHRTAALIVAGLVILICLKPLLWWLFSFDGRVAEILHRTKSSEVRLGKIAESLAPVLDDFPVDAKKPGTTTVFLGQPIDFIHFDPDTGVTFIEVKSGDAKLTTSQRRLKELIESGHVSWCTYRIDGKG
jgi:hypothetical protein